MHRSHQREIAADLGDAVGTDAGGKGALRFRGRGSVDPHKVSLAGGVAGRMPPLRWPGLSCPRCRRPPSLGHHGDWAFDGNDDLGALGSAVFVALLLLAALGT